VIHCDLSEDKQQWEMATGVIEKFGGLDILVNCAGVIFEGDIENTFPQDFDYMMDINLRLPFHLSNIFFPFLEKSKGCIVNVSCMSGLVAS
jgi:NAD(P)-dependent dehydrogenase (short-subunit alcohol dehydrogenase family)